jgi:hypothetical protein
MSVATLPRPTESLAVVRTKAATPYADVRRPAVWLLAIVVVGLGMRAWWQLDAPLQQDEFGPLYAVAERQVTVPGTPPTASDPLVPVAGLEEVRERSVLPYGITNPFPLYHYLLYGVVRALPINEWTLRLPSLLAGLLTIVGIYWICRRLLNAEVALVAAAMAALDPIQIGTSTLVRPYALANFACVLSFASLLGVLRARSLVTATISMIGYALSVGLIGYLNPVLLLVGLAHAALVAYQQFFQVASRRATRTVLWLVGGGLGIALLMPEFDYFRALGAFTSTHRDYLAGLWKRPLVPFLMHNSSFLIALLVVVLAGYIPWRTWLTGEEDGDAADAATPRESPEVLWLGRAWLFLPQLLAVALAYGASQPIFLSRYLGFTTLGGGILLAYWATRQPSREVRLVVVGAVLAITFLWGFTDASRGYGLYTDSFFKNTVALLDKTDERGSWHEGDVVLLRAGFLESDFLADEVPTANRARLEGALKAPLTTLYAPKTPKRIETVRLSFYRRDRIENSAPALVRDYSASDAELADFVKRQSPATQFWICSHHWGRQEFLIAFVPWLADQLQWDVSVARSRRDAERYFDVYTDSKPDEFLDGLTNAAPRDFNYVIRVQRKRPAGIYTLGAFGAAVLPNAHITVPTWLASEARTPRLTERPELDAATSEGELK